MVANVPESAKCVQHFLTPRRRTLRVHRIFTLLREFSKTASISLFQFYIRRAFRILPPYYFYLAVVALLGATGFVVLPPTALVSAALFVWDY
jgi:peptidoglycan/LPS O-acetylase OafA/YrhL